MGSRAVLIGSTKTESCPRAYRTKIFGKNSFATTKSATAATKSCCFYRVLTVSLKDCVILL